MDKWVAAALLYVAVLIGGFTAYEQLIAGKQAAAEETRLGDEHHGASEESGHAHGSESTHENSEVDTIVKMQDDELKIFLKDKQGNPVNELEVNHEKLLHLIVVDEHLQQYYHLHPERTGKGEFTIRKNLPEGVYKAFVDIKPKDLAYRVTPVPFTVGHPGKSAHTEGLAPDSTFTRQVDGETVKLTMSSFKPHEPVTLTFALDTTKLTPYLGAMGHVVILDEAAEQYLHVHPTDHQQPVFETRFERPGIYKIWAEFKQNGKVRAFPFVVEIKGENE